MTLKEIRARMAEIESRKAEIAGALEAADEEQLRAFETEVDELTTERTALVAEEAKHTDLAAKVRSIAIVKPDTRDDGGDERLTRARELKQERAVTVASGQIAQPKKTSGINDSWNEVSSIVDLVNIVPAQGMGGDDVAYQINIANAAKTEENTDAAESDPKFGIAPIRPITIATYSEVSRETMALSDLDYYSRVTNSAYLSLRKEVARMIINSDDAANPIFMGLKNSATIDPASDLIMSGIDETTLRKLTMNYGGDENIVGGGVLLLNKADLVKFGDVRGTNEKKYVYEITPDTANPNTGIIQDGGLSVRYVINSAFAGLEKAAADEYFMAYGAPGCFQLDLFSDYTIRVSEDAAFRRRMVAVLGEAMIGGNVVVYNGFQRVKKAAAETPPDSGEQGGTEGGGTRKK